MEIFNSLLYMLNEMSPYILFGFLIAGVLHAFIPEQMFSRHLAGKDIKSVVKAALIGVPLPLCSCGVLPTAIAMRRNGASKAASTSFLIATPQTGVDSIAATWSLLGPAFAVVRPVAAWVTSVFGGWAVGRAENKNTNDDVCYEIEKTNERQSVSKRIKDALTYGFIDLVGSIGGWLVVGLLVAALITVYVPADFFAAIGDRPIVAMIAVLLIAIPMYVCATGSIPIAMSLVMKGLSPGTALVLLMAGPAVNFASYALISREMGRKTAAIYLASIVLGAIVFGLLIDYVLPARWFVVGMCADACHGSHTFGLFPTLCSVILCCLLIYTQIKNRFLIKTNINSDMITEYKIKGMNCPHCQASVTKAIAAVEGVEQVSVDLTSGIAKVEGKHDGKAIVAAVSAAGFDVAE